MKGVFLSLLICSALLGSITAPPAPTISQIKITRCDCSNCYFKQIGYGSVYVSFGGSRVRCTRTAILRGRTVIGWNHKCPISRRSGKFEIKAGNICGRNYDRVYLNNCSGTPCSAFSG